MERKDKSCRNCLRYTAFYSKGSTYFEKLGFGRCGLRDELVKNKDACIFWISNGRKRELRKKVAIKRLGELSESILQLQQILLEDKEEE